jgi:hypothetical protein
MMMDEIQTMTPEQVRREIAERLGDFVDTTDVGIALALCLEIAKQHPKSNWEWDVLIGEMSSGYYAVFIVHHSVYHREYGDTPALALSRLALAALRGARRINTTLRPRC